MCASPLHGPGIFGTYPDAVLPGLHVIEVRACAEQHSSTRLRVARKQHSNHPLAFGCVWLSTAVHACTRFVVFQQGSACTAPHPDRSHSRRRCPPRAAASRLVPLLQGGQTSTGSIVRWLSHSIIGDGWPGYIAANEAAAQVPPGCEGLLCCDHFQVGWGGVLQACAAEAGCAAVLMLPTRGDVSTPAACVLMQHVAAAAATPTQGNRTPHTDAASRGAFVGLTLKHSQGHVFRFAVRAAAAAVE